MLGNAGGVWEMLGNAGGMLGNTAGMLGIAGECWGLLGNACESVSQISKIKRASRSLAKTGLFLLFF